MRQLWSAFWRGFLISGESFWESVDKSAGKANCTVQSWRNEKSCTLLILSHSPQNLRMPLQKAAHWTTRWLAESESCEQNWRLCQGLHRIMFFWRFSGFHGTRYGRRPNVYFSWKILIFCFFNKNKNEKIIHPKNKISRKLQNWCCDVGKVPFKYHVILFLLFSEPWR